MTLTNDRDVQETRKKLERLEALYQSREDSANPDEELSVAVMQSLKRYINQFKEEIARYEADHVVHT